MKNVIFQLTIGIILLAGGATFSQEIFPGVAGPALLDSLVNRYKPASTLGYTPARDVMFGILDNHDDSVRCVYTGYTVYVPHNDPDAHTIAFNAGLNTEHTWPQSLGATGQAKSDLHHLFPTRIDVNGVRGSLPFEEIPDNLTDRWYRLNYYLTSIPTQFIDEYSEARLNVAFEPREDHKGNVARAMFYFYTMYRNQANSSFFEQQKQTLRAWNSLDPVDAAERQRTQAIAGYQEGKPNPFVLDTSLIGRAYFTVTGIADQPLATGFTFYPNYPNPFNGTTTVRFEIPRAGDVLIELYSLNGQREWQALLANQSPGAHQWRLRPAGLSSGVYLLAIRFASHSQVRKIIYLK